MSRIVGEMHLFVKGSTPPRWLICDGSLYHKDVAPQLYALLKDIARTKDTPPEFFHVPSAQHLLPRNTIMQFMIYSGK